ITNGDRAWAGLDALADAMGRDGDAVRVSLRAAESLGWVAYWPSCPQGPSYTLTPAAADRLGVAIGPYGTWVDRDSIQADGNYVAGRTPHRRSDRPDGDAEAEEPTASLGWLVDHRAVDP